MTLRSASVVVATLLAIVGACDQGGGVVQPCSDIPANGCVLAEDNSQCEDRCCAAAYECVDGEWSYASACPGFVEEPDACAGIVTPSTSEDAGELRDVSDFDVPPGASGNISCPDPEAPDCWLTQALLCDPNGIDPCCGCASLFYCQNGSTILWGSCTDDGGVTETK